MKQNLKLSPYLHKVILITGAGSGIGRETAITFAKEGSVVIITDNNKDSGLETLKMMEKENNESMFIPCDVSQKKEVNHLMEIINKEFKGLDYAFNNAGIEGKSCATDQYEENDWDKVININLKGLWLCMKYELQMMLKKNKGVIINNSSIAGKKGIVGMAPYVASKHAVLGLTKTAALDYAESNIRINAICPGAIKTPMLDRFLQGKDEPLLSQIPMKYFGTPKDIAQAVLWLCSDQSSYITGTTLTIDGGWTT